MRADCHIHMVLDGVYWKAAIAHQKERVDEALVRQRLEEYRRCGAEYLRDGGDAWGVGLFASQIAQEYGIRYRTPAFPIHKNGHYGGFIGRGFDDMVQYRALVAEARAQGAHFIKIMISGLMDFDHLGVLTDEPLTEAEIHDMIAIAHDAGFAVMAHANGDKTVAAAIRAGVDSVEHGAYLEKDTLHLLAERGTVWVPTLVTIGNLIGCGRFPDEVLRPLLSGAMENVRLAASLGARIAPGSDAGAYRVLHGQGMLDEYALLRQAISENADAVLERGVCAIREKF